MTGKEAPLPREREIKEISAPLRLQRNQTFYAQYPFNEVLGEVINQFDGTNPVRYKGKQLQWAQIPEMQADLTTVLSNLTKNFYKDTRPDVKRAGIAAYVESSFNASVPKDIRRKYRANIPESDLRLSWVLRQSVTSFAVR